MAARSRCARFRWSPRPFLLVELDCDDQTLRRRLGHRLDGASVSDARPDLLESFRRGYRAPGELDARERLLLDGALPVEALVRRVRDVLQNGNRPLTA